MNGNEPKRAAERLCKSRAMSFRQAIEEFGTMPPGTILELEPGMTVSQLKRPLVYLACPYSHPMRNTRFVRFQAANVAADMLTHWRDELVFSPISHSHPICEACGEAEPENGPWEYWERFDRAILSLCRKLYVLPLPGWKESKGVQAEIVIAQELGIPVEILPDVFVTGPEAEA